MGPISSTNRPSSIALIIIINSVVLLAIQQFFQLGSLSLPSAPSSDAPHQLRSSSSYPYGLVIPQGKAVALPSIPTSQEEEAKIERKIYGGKGDKAHLGGFTSFDPQGVSPTLWTHMISHLGIKSLLDLGCGIGTSTSWFVLHGLEYVVCAEGSHDAVTQNFLPKIEEKRQVPSGTKIDLVEHDFSRGPWWPERTGET